MKQTSFEFSHVKQVL